MELRSILCGLSDHLIRHHHFRRSELVGSRCLNRTTRPVHTFHEWLSDTPQARDYLAAVGLGDFLSTLLELARHLATKHHYGVERLEGRSLPLSSTCPVYVFLTWLQSAPEAYRWLS